MQDSNECCVDISSPSDGERKASALRSCSLGITENDPVWNTRLTGDGQTVEFCLCPLFFPAFLSLPFFHVYGWCACVSVRHIHAALVEVGRRQQIPWKWSYRLLLAARWCWGSNLGPVEEKSLFLTPELSLHMPPFFEIGSHCVVQASLKNYNFPASASLLTITLRSAWNLSLEKYLVWNCSLGFRV